MDPNETLKRIRSLAHDKWQNEESELADLFLALDEWLTNGGFKPKDWENKR